MLTLAARIHNYSSSHRLICSLLFKPSTSPTTRQYYHRENQSNQGDFNHFLVSLYSWRLIHQPHEPTLHWNSRFRPQQQQQPIELEEQDQPNINWDLWIQQQKQSSRLVPFSQRDNSFSEDQLYFLDPPSSIPMPKRSREHTSIVDLPNKREKYSPCKYSFSVDFTRNINLF